MYYLIQDSDCKVIKSDWLCLVSYEQSTASGGGEGPWFTVPKWQRENGGWVLKLKYMGKDPKQAKTIDVHFS